MKISFLLFFLCCSTALFAQNKMQPVSITDNNNQTKEGFAKLTNNIKLCAGVFYSPVMTSKASALQHLTAKDVKMVHFTEFNRKFYTKEVFKIYKTEEQLYRIDSTKTDTVLLELLVGTKDTKLFAYQTKQGKKRFFIEHPKTGFLELKEKVTTIKKDGVSYKHRNKKFVGILKLIFTNCPTLNKLYFSKVSLAPRSLAKVFLDYNKCTPIDIEHIAPSTQEKAHLNLVLGSGVSYALSTRNNNAKGFSYLINPIGEFSVPAYIGVLLYPPTLRNTVFLGLGVLYNHKGTKDIEQRTKFDLHYFGFNFNLGYQVPLKKVKPFFGPELSFNILLNPATAFTQQYLNIGQERTRVLFYDPNNTPLAHHELAFGGFVGVDIALGKQYSTRILVKYLHGRYSNLTRLYSTHYLELQAQFRINFQKPKR